MDIFLVRHGEAAASWEQEADPGLSAFGAQQAVDASRLLLPKLGNNVRLVSSPLRRTQETAYPLAERLELTVTVDAAFREIPAVVPLAERKAWLQNFMCQSWSAQPSELVHWRDLAMKQLLLLKTPTVVFTHFLVLNAVVGRILDHAGTLYFRPDNGSITHLNLTESGSLELVSLGAQMDTVVI